MSRLLNEISLLHCDFVQVLNFHCVFALDILPVRKTNGGKCNSNKFNLSMRLNTNCEWFDFRLFHLLRGAEK